MTKPIGMPEIEKAGRAVLDRFMAALNIHDADAMDACMHFPHIRMAECSVVVYEAPGDNPMDLFDRLKEQDNWHHSAWDDRELIQRNDAKAPLAAQLHALPGRWRCHRSV